MSDLRDLYQEVIVDHSKRPRNFKELEGANRKAEGFNPLCGDRVTVFLKIEDGKVVAASFQGSGCAISTSSASMMTEAVRGKTEAEVQALFDRFHRLLIAAPADAIQMAENEAEELGKLAVFQGVCEFPARVKCASLSWHALHTALLNHGGTVTSEGTPDDLPGETTERAK